MVSPIRPLTASLLAILLAWCAGFVWFVRIATAPVAAPPHADGIVVLTGGADRVRTALRLLAEARAAQLLVSGIGGGADLEDLARRAGLDAKRLAPRVTLGRGAATTHGNAAETAAWARRNDIRSLIVVTAFYHMPRALVEMRHALPTVRLYPCPVRPPGMRRLDGLDSWVGVRLMVGEYTKYLVAAVGLTQLMAVQPPLLSPAGRRGEPT